MARLVMAQLPCVQDESYCRRYSGSAHHAAAETTILQGPVAELLGVK